jgi:hypothetical protein
MARSQLALWQALFQRQYEVISAPIVAVFEVNRFVTKYSRRVLYGFDARENGTLQPKTFCNVLRGRGVKLSVLSKWIFEPDRGKPIVRSEASLTTRIFGSGFGGKDYELRVCFFSGDCLTPQKIVW